MKVDAISISLRPGNLGECCSIPIIVEIISREDIFRCRHFSLVFLYLSLKSS
jgi:hypothetical protein